MNGSTSHALTTRVNPDASALPVATGLAGLLPGSRLRRGSTVEVEGATSLALALLAAPSAAGSWCAVVGVPGLGVLAAAELGVTLERLVLVPRPGREWASVVATLVDAFDVVVACPPDRIRPGQARRLGARVRQRGALLVLAGPWEGADLRMWATDQSWEGLSEGYGRLRARRMTVRVSGRGAAVRPREGRLWLPALDGGIVPDEDAVAGSCAGGDATTALPLEPALPAAEAV